MVVILFRSRCSFGGWRGVGGSSGGDIGGGDDVGHGLGEGGFKERTAEVVVGLAEA